ncbi:MAG: hypothetical protein CVU45_02320, partial [Chloroflexi bacterium HGW-Chloroflexi-7]
MKSKPSILSSEIIQPLLDSLSSNIAILDEHGTIILVNQAWKNFGEENGCPDINFGIGQNYLSLCEKVMGVGKDEARQVAEGIKKVLADEIREVFVDYPCHSPEEKRWFRVKIAKFAADKKYVILIHTNNSQNRIIEENLHETEDLFKRVIEQSSEGVVIIDENGKIIEWNKAEEKITGLSRHEVIGRYMWEIQAETSSANQDPKFLEFLKQGTMQLLATGTSPWAGKPTETKIVKPDGTEATLESVVFPIKHNHGYLACSINHDVTEIRNSRKAQQLSESRFRTYVNYSPVIALVINQKGDFLDVNPQAIQKLGFSENELFKMNIAELIPSDEQEKTAELLLNLNKNGQASAEYQIITKSGNKLLLNSKAVNLPDQSIMILCNDISELRESQIKLKESEAFLNSILDNIPSLITVKEAETLKYFKVNRPVEEYLNMPGTEILGKTAYEIFSKGEAKFFTEQDKLTLQGKQIVDIPVENGLSK